MIETLPPNTLTTRQQETLHAIRALVAAHRRPPTLREVALALGLRSPSTVAAHVAALEARGYLVRTPHTPRGLALTEDDDVPRPEPVPLLCIGQADSRRPHQLRNPPRRKVLRVPATLVPEAADPEACLLATAHDDGLSGEGILKGDLLLVEETPRDQLTPGDTVAVVMDQAVHARLYAGDARTIRLHTRNRHYLDVQFAPDDPGCHIIGRVVGLIRRL